MIIVDIQLILHLIFLKFTLYIAGIYTWYYLNTVTLNRTDKEVDTLYLYLQVCTCNSQPQSTTSLESEFTITSDGSWRITNCQQQSV